MKVGFLTIGQSPRDDVIPDIKSLLSPNIDVVEHGLLDNLSLEQINALKPDPHEFVLVSRLRNGRQVELSEAKIGKLLPHAVEFMTVEMGVKEVGILCTHKFPRCEYSCQIIFPSEHMKTIIDEILGVQKLGVVIPLDTQRGMAKRKWGEERTFVMVKSPYTEGKMWKDIANSLIQKEVEAVVLDCIGYSIKNREELQRFLSVPILLPRSILANALNQLL